MWFQKGREVDVKKNRAQKIMVVQEREWSEKERMEKKQWLKGFFAVDLQENVIEMENSCNISERGGNAPPPDGKL